MSTYTTQLLDLLCGGALVEQGFSPERSAEIVRQVQALPTEPEPDDNSANDGYVWSGQRERVAAER